MKKIMLVFGTRPEAIKMCMLYSELKKRGDIRVVLVISSQHKELLRSVLDDFGVREDYDLSLMCEGQSLSGVCARVISGLEDIVEKEKPDMIAVHGDTTTAFAGAVCGFYTKIPVAHIEAGLRTYSMTNPYPEEFNRRGIALVAQLHFAPTEAARQNLIREGISDDNIFVTGNTAIDVLMHSVKADFSHPLLDWVGARRLLLITAHRRENIGGAMQSALRGIRRALSMHPDTVAIYPMHPNPEVRATAVCELGGCDCVKLVQPLCVSDFHNLLARCTLVLTDSGGIQEEASHLGKPTLVLREHTERGEGVGGGTLRLVGTDEENVCREICTLLDDEEEYGKMAIAQTVYGDGRASVRIARILCDRMNGK